MILRHLSEQTRLVLFVFNAPCLEGLVVEGQSEVFEPVFVLSGIGLELG